MIHYKITYSADWYRGRMICYLFAISERAALRKFKQTHKGCKIEEISKANLLKQK